MGFYRTHVLPRLVDRACGGAGMRHWRADVTDGLAGRVVEIGFGSGLNVRHYPPEVELVFAVEPAEVARRLAAKRIAAGGVSVEHVGLDGQAIPLDDASCDAALSTFTLCTVPDPTRALSELRRVLRPGGRFHFLEHGLAPDPSVARWQHRLDPWQRRLADGCHLTRDAETLVADAGFLIERVEHRYAKGPKPWSWFTLGVAANPPS
ncbi:MAG: class I SAM-dependent methyltransferase [Acidimicrobiales bacterium]